MLEVIFSEGLPQVPPLIQARASSLARQAIACPNFTPT